MNVVISCLLPSAFHSFLNSLRFGFWPYFSAEIALLKVSSLHFVKSNGLFYPSKFTENWHETSGRLWVFGSARHPSICIPPASGLQWPQCLEATLGWADNGPKGWVHGGAQHRIPFWWQQQGPVWVWCWSALVWKGSSWDNPSLTQNHGGKNLPGIWAGRTNSKANFHFIPPCLLPSCIHMSVLSNLKFASAGQLNAVSNFPEKISWKGTDSWEACPFVLPSSWQECWCDRLHSGCPVVIMRCFSGWKWKDLRSDEEGNIKRRILRWPWRHHYRPAVPAARSLSDESKQISAF